MDFITTKFQKKEEDNESKCQRKKRGLDECIQLREGESGSEKKKDEFVPKEVWQKRKKEQRCIKHGRSNYQGRDCKAPSVVKTSPYLDNSN